ARRAGRCSSTALGLPCPPYGRPATLREGGAEMPSASKVADESFLMTVLSGCVEYKPLMDVVVDAFYIRDGKHCLLSELVCYLATFQLEELGLQQFSRMVKSMDVAKICKFLRFFFNVINLRTWIKDEWSQIYDSDHVNQKWIEPLQRWQPKVQELVDLLDDKQEKLSTRTSKKTEPKEFHLTVPNPRAILIPELVLQQEKVKPVPENTYRSPRLKQRLEGLKLKNRRRAENAVTAFNLFQGSVLLLSMPLCLVPLQVDSLPVKLNAAAILREGVLYQRKEEQELDRIERLLRGARDPSEFLEWQKQMRGKDLDQQLTEAACRRLQGKLSYEEAILSHQNCMQENQKKKEEMSRHCAERHDQERKERKRLVQQVIEGRKNGKQAQTKLQKGKRQIVQEVSEESKELLLQALNEEEEKFKKRCELIQQIRAIEYVPFLKNTFVDLTQSPNHGVLGEMSIVELQERLALLKESQKKAEEERRDLIIHEKLTKEQLLLGKLEQIAAFREQLGRAAALKQEEKKIKAPYHESILKDERVLELQKKVVEKSTARKKQNEFLKTTSPKFSDASERAWKSTKVRKDNTSYCIWLQSRMILSASLCSEFRAVRIFVLKIFPSLVNI
uniref:Cilia and flagella associated protein 99 n=1 Tax=Varanus komodoensis TaxID=61221 RepID=A0A8D2J2Y7_VARKO